MFISKQNLIPPEFLGKKKMKFPAEIFVRGKERTGSIVAKTLQLSQSTIIITFYGQKDKRMFS